MSDFLNPGGYFLVMGVFALFATILCSKIQRFGDLVQSGSGRFAALDGLRGILATSVFVHHALINREFAATGVWDSPDSRFFAYLGDDSVHVFFMITGFLFWRKSLFAEGRGLPVGPLMRSRVRRIMPMYLLSAALVVLLALFSSGFQL